MELTKSKAKQLYSSAPEWFQKELEQGFPAGTFKRKDFNDIKTFEDACEDLGINSDAVIIDGLTADEIAYKKLKIIIEAINQGWTPDWNNSDQYKYYPWFNLSSGSGFSSSAYVYDYTGTSVGSRLCFESRDKAVYTANQFKDLYKDFFTL